MEKISCVEEKNKSLFMKYEKSPTINKKVKKRKGFFS